MPSPSPIASPSADAPLRSLATSERPRGSRSRRSPVVWVAPRRRSRPTSTTHLMLTKDLRIAPRANAGLGAPRAAYGACQGTRSPRASAWQNARRHGVAAQPFARSRPALERTPRGATCARTGRGTPAPLRYGTPRPTAPPVGSCLQSSPDALRASRRYEARASRHRRAVSARHTHPAASGRAERLRLCEPHKSADRSQSRTSSSGSTSATARSSSLRSASPVLRDSSVAITRPPHQPAAARVAMQNGRRRPRRACVCSSTASTGSSRTCASSP